MNRAVLMTSKSFAGLMKSGKNTIFSRNRFFRGRIRPTKIFARPSDVLRNSRLATAENFSSSAANAKAVEFLRRRDPAQKEGVPLLGALWRSGTLKKAAHAWWLGGAAARPGGRAAARRAQLGPLESDTQAGRLAPTQLVLATRGGRSRAPGAPSGEARPTLFRPPEGGRLAGNVCLRACAWV